MSERPDPPDDEDRLLAAEYAIGVLQGTDRDSFAKRIAADPAIAAEVRYWDEHFAGLTDQIAAVIPPSRVQSQIEKRLFATGNDVSAWNSLGLWRWLALSAFIALIAFAGWTMSSGPTGPQTALVAQVAGETHPVKLYAFYNDATGELRLNRTAGSAAANRSFELWLIVGRDAPISLGVLPAETMTHLKVPSNLRGKLNGSLLAISDEPAGGSPTGAPTGAVLGTGQLTPV
jgi:anti-sigma-K factor RskA